MLRILLVLLVLAASPAAQTIPNLSFSEDGLAVAEQPNDGLGYGVARLTNGAVVTAGPLLHTFPGGFDLLGSTVTAFQEDGTPLATFGDSGTVRLIAGPSDILLALSSVAPLPGGRVALAGYAKKDHDQTRRQPVVVALTAQGALDTTFGTDGVLLLEPGSDFSATGVRLKTDGDDVYLCGELWGGAGEPSTSYVARVRDGEVDPDYAALGYFFSAPDVRFTDCDVRNSRLYVTGTFSGSGGEVLFLGLTADGHVDPAFGFTTRRAVVGQAAIGFSVAATSRGVLVAGMTDQAGTPGRALAIWRVRTDGDLDQTFGDNGVLVADLNAPQASTGYVEPLRPLLLPHGSVGVPFSSLGSDGTRLGVFVAWEDGTPDPDNGNLDNGVAYPFGDRMFFGVHRAVPLTPTEAYVSATVRADDDRYQPAVARLFVKLDPVSGEADPGVDESLTAAPNPARGRTTVALSLTDAAAVSIAIYDVLGRRIATLRDGPAAAGELRTTWDASGAAPGAYMVVARVGDAVTTRRISVVR